MRGGRVVIGSDVVARDILVESGRVDVIVEPGQGRANDEVDARGLLVLPGAVDAHAHFNEPGRAEWEGWAAGTRGAALGGITTVADMPLNSVPPTLDGASFDAKREAAAASAVVDHALWGGLVPGADAGKLRELRMRGAVGLKAFMTESGIEEFPHLPDAELRSALALAANAGLAVAVHCEDDALTREGAERARAEGASGAAGWLGSRPPEAEAAAIDRLADAALAVGARVHVVHASGRAAVSAVRRAKARAVWLTAETCPHYLAFTSEDVERKGASLKCAPPIRTAADRAELWRALGDGALDLVASDHSPCPANMKQGELVAAWGGVAGIQSFLPVLLTEGLRAKRLRLPALVRLVAEAPARLLGLFPRKGSIRPHSDADLVLVDPDREWTLEETAVQARSAVSPYAGRRFTGAVVRTIVRGVTVQLEGEIVAAAGHGKLVTP
ncbi:MAG: allantoinase AllB [Candidatus Limnocylindria bacterium]